MWAEPKNSPSEQLGSFQDLGSAGVFYPLEGSKEKPTQSSLIVGQILGRQHRMTL